MKTLADIYQKHSGKVSDKWALYLCEYDRLFLPYKKLPISLLEIGVQNGGSIEIWSKYFLNAKIFIGCDINPECAKLWFDDSRISIVIGDATTEETRKKALLQSSSFDVIIEDGSHISSDIIKTFANFFPYLKEGGIFVTEDLHCSYWQEFEGGIYYPYSSVNFFKLIADLINYEHWGVTKTRNELIEGFKKKLSIEFTEELLSQIHSIEFINSLCVIKKSSSNKNLLGSREVVGAISNISTDSMLLKDSNISVPTQSLNIYSTLDLLEDEKFQNLYESRVYFQEIIKKFNNTKNNTSITHFIVELDNEVLKDKRLIDYSSVQNNLNTTLDIMDNKKHHSSKYTTSLIIPYFNGKEFIDRCIDSALNQSEKYDEIIIVNDGSTKIESDYLDKFVFKNNIIVLHKENGGQGSARNLGARHATSDFISFLDQDDFCLPHHNSSLKPILVENLDCGYVYGDAVEADGMGNILRYGMIKEHALHPKSHIVHFIGQDCFILPSAMMITKNAFNSISGFDEQFTGYEDDDLVLRLWRKGYKGIFLDQPVYVWCIHQNSTSFSVRMSKSRIKYINKLVEMFPTQPKLGRYWFRDQIYPRFKNNIFHDLQMTRESINNSEEYVKIYEIFFQLCRDNKMEITTLLKLKIYRFIIVYMPDFVKEILVHLYKTIKSKKIFRWI